MQCTKAGCHRKADVRINDSNVCIEHINDPLILIRSTIDKAIDLIRYR